MHELIDKLPIIVGALVSILSALKSVGLFEMRTKRIERIEKLCSISVALKKDNQESRKNIENILTEETRILREQANRKLDPGGLFAMMFMSIVLGFVTYLTILWFVSINLNNIIDWALKILSGTILFFMIIVDVAAIFTGQKSMFKNKENIQ